MKVKYTSDTMIMDIFISPTSPKIAQPSSMCSTYVINMELNKIMK